MSLEYQCPNHMVLFLRKIFGTKRALIQFVLTIAVGIYALVTILANPDPGNIVGRRVDQLTQLLEYTARRSEELRQMIEDLSSHRIQLDQQAAQKLIDKLEHDLQNPINAQNNSAEVRNVVRSSAAVERPVDFLPPEPNFEYELLRRRIHNNIDEIWNYFGNELSKIRKGVARTKPTTEQVLELGAEHTRSMLGDLERLRQVDGYETWRQQEAHRLTDLVQRRLHYLQNPKDCKSARKLVCELNKECGFGCQLHHVVYCFIAAYAMERTMILESGGWRYDPSGWDQVFLPVSETCVVVDRNETDALYLPTIEMLFSTPQYMPLAIPEDLAPRLQRLHGNPAVWWVGQFLKYLLRLQNATAYDLESKKSKLGWQKPIVGVHVRLTDKLRVEAAAHKIEEYMKHVEDYFLKFELNGTTLAPRRIFLATDDASILKHTRKQYPQYEVIGDVQVVHTAAESKRYSRTSLIGVIEDIYFLSHCDYIVCTFSSHFCRLTYEIMQTLHPDAAHCFKSLDEIYYFGGQSPHDWRTVIGHKKRNFKELDMQPNDVMGVAGNRWDGFSQGKNRRTKLKGLFPSFKIVDKVKTVSLPLYEQVPLQV